MNGPVPTGVGLEFPAFTASIMAWPKTNPTWVVSPAANPGLGAASLYTTVMASGAVTEVIWVRAWPVSNDAFSTW